MDFAMKAPVSVPVLKHHSGRLLKQREGKGSDFSSFFVLLQGHMLNRSTGGMEKGEILWKRRIVF